MVKSKINYVINWEANNYNTHIVQYLKKLSQSDNDFGQLIEYSRNIFLQNSCEKDARRLVPDLFLIY